MDGSCLEPTRTTPEVPSPSSIPSFDKHGNYQDSSFHLMVLISSFRFPRLLTLRRFDHTSVASSKEG